jgi:hypothetical protein
MSAEQPQSGEESEEPWLSREELVEREYQIWREKYEAAQRWIDERCKQVEERWRATHPWIDDPGMCVTVPVRHLVLPDENL